MSQELERFALVIASKKTGKVKGFTYSYLASMLKIYALNKLRNSEQALLVNLSDGHIIGRFTGQQSGWTSYDDLTEYQFYVEDVLLEALLEEDDIEGSVQ